jgi:hypothetical protein
MRNSQPAAVISAKEAEAIALRCVAERLVRAARSWDVPRAPRAIERPATFNSGFESLPLDEPAWYVFAPWCDGVIGLRASRVIVISKTDGRVMYDGSANDEG